MVALLISTVFAVTPELALAGQAPDANAALKQLRNRYPFQSIYLTYIPLLELTLLLNEDDKYKSHLRNPLWKDSLPVLKKYLNDNYKLQLNQAIAFLQLDLANLQAGVKAMNDRGAEITKIPWGADTVTGVSLFSDQFLSGRLKTDAAVAHMSLGKWSVTKAWEELGALKDDPFVPTQTLGKPLQQFQKLIETRPEEMKKLQKEDKSRFDKIQKFHLGYRPALRDRELQVEEWATLSRQLKLMDRREMLRDADALELYFKALGESTPVVVPKGDKLPNLGHLINPSTGFGPGDLPH